MKALAISALFALLALGASPSALAGSAEASWDAVTLDVAGGPEHISHYLLFYGTASRPAGVGHPDDGTFHYDHRTNVGDQTRVIQEGLAGGQVWYFSVAAVDRSGNTSDYSTEESVELPPDSQPDGGQVDGGGEADAGSLPDGGTTPVVIEGGCGCSVGPADPSCWLAACTLLVLCSLARRRREI
ncbi:MAG: hypothetical protein JXR96_22065 [Deltaproteobacteria bacterium]|nr:hypothetical protein [Deltaproteobacteria bacterium]